MSYEFESMEGDYPRWHKRQNADWSIKPVLD